MSSCENIVSTIVDMNNVPIKVGQRVRVHQEEGISYAKVTDISNSQPTINFPGYWVDINKDNVVGNEGMMSYCLEVLPN